MKLLSLLLLISSTVFARGVIEEHVVIENYSKKNFELIKSQTELTIDHVFKDHFDLYGPKGMSEWLQNSGISFKKETNHKHISNFKNYPTHQDITKGLQTIVSQYPSILKLISVGKSVKGRDLWAVKISDNVNVDEVEPEFKYVSSMHGDEIVGRELTMELIEYIAKNYATDSSIKNMVDNTEIFVMPSMNPDGSMLKQRANGNRIDLNRNFPDWMRGDSDTTGSRQPETIALMNWQASRNFALSANFHGGAVVVNYPWDTTAERHPLDKLVTQFSREYADLNPEMRNSGEFAGGITNGADWYELNGGMQDWSYYWYNDLQVTVELSNTKWPRYSKIKSYWDDNKDSLLRYIELVHQGGGFKFATLVGDGSGTVKVEKLESDGSTTKLGSFGFSNGEFYKVLEMGSYVFRVTDSSGRVTTIPLSVNGMVSASRNYTEI